MRQMIVLFLASLLLASACGDDSPADDTADAPVEVPDAPVLGPDAPPGCETALPLDWRPHDEVSAGAVTTTAGAPNVLEIDASAGGMGEYMNEPFVYLSFTGGSPAKVEITDIESYASTGWHMGFKRYLVRINSDDSGPGDVRIAAVSATSLDEVTSAPSANQFEIDDWATEDCIIAPGQMEEPLVACDWWVMVGTTGVEPLPLVWVLDLGDGTMIKLRFVSYYGDPSNPVSSGHYWIEWAAL